MQVIDQDTAIKTISLVKDGDYRLALDTMYQGLKEVYRQTHLVSDRDIHIRLSEYALKRQEHVVVFSLSGENTLLGESVVAIGTQSSAPFHPRDVLAPAIQAGAEKLLLAHSHPNGIAIASDADYRATYNISAACQATGIEFVDHLIVAHHRLGVQYHSLETGEYELLTAQELTTEIGLETSRRGNDLAQMDLFDSSERGEPQLLHDQIQEDLEAGDISGAIQRVSSLIPEPDITQGLFSQEEAHRWASSTATSLDDGHYLVGINNYSLPISITRVGDIGREVDPITCTRIGIQRNCAAMMILSVRPERDDRMVPALSPENYARLETSAAAVGIPLRHTPEVYVTRPLVHDQLVR
jgi:hypothetical protein